MMITNYNFKTIEEEQFGYQEGSKERNFWSFDEDETVKMMSDWFVSTHYDRHEAFNKSSYDDGYQSEDYSFRVSCDYYSVREW